MVPPAARRNPSRSRERQEVPSRGGKSLCFSAGSLGAAPHAARLIFHLLIFSVMLEMCVMSFRGEETGVATGKLSQNSRQFGSFSHDDSAPQKFALSDGGLCGSLSPLHYSNLLCAKFCVNFNRTYIESSAKHFTSKWSLGEESCGIGRVLVRAVLTGRGPCPKDRPRATHLLTALEPPATLPPDPLPETRFRLLLNLSSKRRGIANQFSGSFVFAQHSRRRGSVNQRTS